MPIILCQCYKLTDVHFHAAKERLEAAGTLPENDDKAAKKIFGNAVKTDGTETCFARSMGGPCQHCLPNVKRTVLTNSNAKKLETV